MHVYEDSDCEDYPPMTSMQRKILVSTSIAVFVALITGCLVGFVMGQKFFKGTHVCPKVTHRIGYTIESANTIRTCCNEVRFYNWQIKPLK